MDRQLRDLIGLFFISFGEEAIYERHPWSSGCGQEIETENRSERERSLRVEFMQQVFFWELFHCSWTRVAHLLRSLTDEESGSGFLRAWMEPRWSYSNFNFDPKMYPSPNLSLYISPSNPAEEQMNKCQVNLSLVWRELVGSNHPVIPPNNNNNTTRWTHIQPNPCPSSLLSRLFCQFGVVLFLLQSLLLLFCLACIVIVSPPIHSSHSLLPLPFPCSMSSFFFLQSIVHHTVVSKYPFPLLPPSWLGPPPLNPTLVHCMLFFCSQSIVLFFMLFGRILFLAFWFLLSLSLSCYR